MWTCVWHATDQSTPCNEIRVCSQLIGVKRMIDPILDAAAAAAGAAAADAIANAASLAAAAAATA